MLSHEELQSHLTIQRLWKEFKLSGEYGEICSNPFNDDDSKSFEIGWHGPNEHWKDAKTGENGDVIDFFGLCAGIKDKAEASKEYNIRANRFVNEGISPAENSPKEDHPKETKSPIPPAAKEPKPTTANEVPVVAPNTPRPPVTQESKPKKAKEEKDFKEKKDLEPQMKQNTPQEQCTANEEPVVAPNTPRPPVAQESMPKAQKENVSTEEKEPETQRKQNTPKEQCTVKEEPVVVPTTTRPPELQATEPPNPTEVIGNPFPTEALPKSVRDYAMSVAIKAGVPVENVMPLILGATSISIGKGAKVVDSTGLCTWPNLYIVVSQETGTGKSRAFREVIHPIEEAQEELQELWEEQSKHSLMAKLEGLEIAAKETKGKIRTSGPEDREEHVKTLASISKEIETVQNQLNPPIFFIEDANPSSIEQILQQHNGNLSIAGSEARSVADSLMDKGKTTHQAIFLKGFDGDSINAHRSSMADKYFSVKEPVMQILISMQPDKLESLYASKDAHDSGVLGRIQIAGTSNGSTPTPNQSISPDTEKQWNDLIQTILKLYRKRKTSPQEFGLEEGGLEALDKMNDEIAQKINDCTYLHVRNSARRRVEYVRKFALLLHLLKNPKDAPSEISLETLKEAQQVETWFFENLLEFRASTIRKDELDDEAKVLERLEMHPEGLSRNQIRKYCKLPNAEATKQVLGRLEASEKVTHWTTQPKGGGTRSDMYKLAA